MNHLVASADYNSAFGDCARRIVGELPLTIAIAPTDAVSHKIDCDHLVIERAVERLLTCKSGRRSGVSARRYMEHFFAVGYSDSAKRLSATGDVRHAVRHAGRAMNRAAGPELPDQRAVRCRDTIEVLIVRTDRHSIAYHDR